MALQASGAISLGNLQTEYGGANPISLSEYYRNGTYVPDSIVTSTLVREPASGENYSSLSAPTYVWVANYYDNSQLVQIQWNNVALNPPVTTATSYTSGAYTYYRGTFREGYSFLSQSYFGIYRTSGSSTTTYVNQTVPTSGTVSLSQFYEGRKT